MVIVGVNNYAERLGCKGVLNFEVIYYKYHVIFNNDEENTEARDSGGSKLLVMYAIFNFCQESSKFDWKQRGSIIHGRRIVLVECVAY